MIPLYNFFHGQEGGLRHKEEWEEKTTRPFDENPKYSYFINFLTNKCIVLETSEPTCKLVRFNWNKPVPDKIVSHSATLSNIKY